MPLKDNEKKKNGIGDEVVEEIKKNCIKMKSPQYFIVISFLWLGLGAVSFAVSLILLGFSIHYLNEYEFFGLIRNGYFSLWIIAPLLIMTFSVFLIYLSSRFYRKGRICCRHEEWMLLSAMGLVVILGLFVLAESSSFKKWRDFVEDGQTTQKLIISAKGFWSEPEEGRLFGEVIKTDQNKKYILIKKEGALWKVHTGDCECQINHETVKTGSYIKMIGKFNGEVFGAKDIWYWE